MEASHSVVRVHRRSLPPWTHPVHRAVIGAVLVAALVVMGAVTVAFPGGSAGGMAAMDGMAATDAMAAGADVLLPTDPEPAALVVSCEAMCGDLVSVCLAVLVLLGAFAMASPGLLRLVRAGPFGPSAGTSRREAAEWPPWSVSSLSQLSVLRV